jgi:hypothetical protein
VKVCSLYGAGYYYMPGTDICLKLGGYVRYQFTWNPGSSITAGPMFGQGGRNTRADSLETAHRTRALITVDTRQQTAYGTLRTYILLGYSQDSTAVESTSPAVYMTRGFIQIAGFTFGKATSFFDIMPGASFAYNAGFFHHPDTGDAGKMLAAYTAQFGNGVSGTIAFEQARVRGIVRTGIAGGVTATPGGLGLGGYGLNGLANPPDVTEGGLAKGVAEYPDVVGNIRIDQSWGTWLVGAAAHVNRAQYFGITGIGTTAAGTVAAPAAAVATINTGGPDYKIGWAATTGFILNLPMIAAGDRLSAGVVYSEGAVAYASVTPSGAFMNRWSGNRVGFGFWEDAVFEGSGTLGFAGKLNLTTAWSASAAFEHLWTPALKTSWYGSYVDISHNANATTLICNSGASGVIPFTAAQGAISTATAVTSPFTPGNPALTGCSPDWSSWNAGSRTQWEPVKGLVMGIDVIYQKLNSATSNTILGNTFPLSAQTGANPPSSNQINPLLSRPVPWYHVEDPDSWTGTVRIQRDFLP